MQMSQQKVVIGLERLSPFVQTVVFTKEESSGKEPRAGVQQRRKVIWSTPLRSLGPTCGWLLPFASGLPRSTLAWKSPAG